MRYDIENQLCNAQAFTASAVSTNSYQKQSAAQDLSIGRRMAVMYVVVVAAGTGSTWNLQAVQADVTALTTNIEVLGTVQVAAALMTKGAVFEVPIPQGTMTRLHLGARAIPESGGTETVTLDAYLVPQEEIPYFRTFPKVVGSGA